MTELVKIRTPGEDDGRFYRNVTVQILTRDEDGSPRGLMILDDDSEFDFEEYAELMKILVPESQFKTP